MSSASSAAYGIKPLTLTPPPSGSNGSPGSTVKTNLATNNATQVRINKIGGSKRSFRGGSPGNGTITVNPLPATSVPVAGGPGQNPNDNNLNLTKNQATNYKQSELDGAVAYGGRRPKGRRQSLKGGWPAWRCMSGGRSRTCRRKGRRTCRKGRGRGKTCRGRRRK